ncbi:Imidazole glycerol phosphate synthase subunit HisH 1 [Pannonibacter phragmitetus]|uniref:Imidazole glycerol phosphate synthase subunit HisH n=1 Tax=Pannonibacter phragmitetus TaxID=121719 RepID=A0A378ZQQ5_9HYPH|nr:imidazole glycerol phosphate synthase subunit HisH [Pannonibacter phragmitetus]SUA99139.1 Imidazole glycerol phosphate synthase subunit HisH 1 [Pannonibacter phragmitetus]
MIGIVDYGSGNISAIANIYKHLRIPCLVSGNPDELAGADRFILPGVGAFDTVMNDLGKLGIIDMLNEEVIGKGKMAMGICVGMQILANSSEEGEGNGLGWVPGRVRRIDASRLNRAPKLPHMGWNSITPADGQPIFTDVDAERGFYFLHSFYFDPDSSSDIISTVNYGGELACGVRRKNVFGFQFHPEKSHGNGLAIFKNFAEI